MSYDNWKLASPYDEAEDRRRRREKSEAEEAMEAEEWKDLGATDLLSAEELADFARMPTDLSDNNFSDV